MLSLRSKSSVWHCGHTYKTWCVIWLFSAILWLYDIAGKSTILRRITTVCIDPIQRTSFLVSNFFAPSLKGFKRSPSIAYSDTTIAVVTCFITTRVSTSLNHVGPFWIQFWTRLSMTLFWDTSTRSWTSWPKMVSLNNFLGPTITLGPNLGCPILSEWVAYCDPVSKTLTYFHEVFSLVRGYASGMRSTFSGSIASILRYLTAPV